jgi:hypothetical protein
MFVANDDDKIVWPESVKVDFVARDSWPSQQSGRFAPMAGQLALALALALAWTIERSVALLEQRRRGA